MFVRVYVLARGGGEEETSMDLAMEHRFEGVAFFLCAFCMQTAVTKQESRWR